METAGGPELHRPALVPALHRLLRWHGEHRLCPSAAAAPGASISAARATLLVYTQQMIDPFISSINSADLDPLCAHG